MSQTALETVVTALGVFPLPGSERLMMMMMMMTTTVVVVVFSGMSGCGIENGGTGLPG